LGKKVQNLAAELGEKQVSIKNMKNLSSRVRLMVIMGVTKLVALSACVFGGISIRQSRMGGTRVFAVRQENKMTE